MPELSLKLLSDTVLFLTLSFLRMVHLMEGSGSIGRVTDSKSVGWGFKSLLPCQFIFEE